MRWGLLGGTFDPIHFGHLRCAEEVRELFHLDRVIFIPAARQPLKTAQTTSSFPDRYRMVERAIGANSFFAVSDVEATRGGVSYSIDTVRYFLDQGITGDALYFIVGQDAFDDIGRWKQYNDLLSLCNFVVMTRPGYDLRKLPDVLTLDAASQFVYDTQQDGFRGPAGRYIYFRALTLLDISATDIRTRVRQGRSIMYLVPDAVRQYLAEQKLYRQ